MAPAELPDWVTYIGGALGIVATTVIIRLGWNKSAGETRPEQGRLIGALVDAGSVKDLSIAVEAYTETLKAVGEEHSRELRNLGDEVRRLANKLER